MTSFGMPLPSVIDSMITFCRRLWSRSTPMASPLATRVLDQFRIRHHLVEGLEHFASAEREHAGRVALLDEADRGLDRAAGDHGRFDLG